MPRATTNANDTKRYDLKSLPEGYVVLRRMPYGLMIDRRASASKLDIEGKAGRRNQDLKATMQMIQRRTIEMEFANCIVEHNLTDDNDQDLDFKAPNVLSVLDPRVGEEISTYIDEMNQWEDDLGNLSNGSAPA